MVFDVAWQGHRLIANGELDFGSCNVLTEAVGAMLSNLTQPPGAPGREIADTRDARLQPAHVVVDVAGLTFIDAAGLGVLVGSRNGFAAVGLTMSVVNPSRMLRRLCGICELGSLLGESDPDLVQPVGRP